MPASRVNDYHFVTRWTVQGTCGEVSDVLGDPLDLPRWWPSVYLNRGEESLVRELSRRRGPPRRPSSSGGTTSR